MNNSITLATSLMKRLKLEQLDAITSKKGKIEHRGPEYNGSISLEADLRDQIAQLKSQLEDNEKIIKLLDNK